MGKVSIGLRGRRFEGDLAESERDLAADHPTDR